MSMAFEISVDDVQIAVEDYYDETNQNVEVTREWCEEMLDEIDDGIVEKAALCGDDMDEQIAYAHQSIIEQIKPFLRGN